MTLFKFGTAKSAAPPAPPTIGTANEVRQEFFNDRFIGGRGIVFPMRRDLRGDYETTTGDTLLAQKIIQVLATDALAGGSMGEMAGVPEFGSRLRLLHNRNLDETSRELAGVLTREALELWVPDADIDSIVVLLDGIDNDNDKAGYVITVFYTQGDTTQNQDISDVTVFKAL